MTARSHVKRAAKVTAVLIAVAVSMACLGLNPEAAQAATSIYVVAVGDIACDPSPQGTPNYYPAYNNGNGTADGCRHKGVAAAVIAAKPDQFWALGDNQYFDGTYAKYMEAYDSAFGPLKAITRPIPGNHEWKDLTLPTKPGSGYYTYFGAAAHPESNGTYSFDAGDWHVLAINDNLCDAIHPCGTGSALATWIASDMAASQKPCTVAMWHHPLWSLGESHKGGYGPLVPVWNQLNDLGVDMVLTGHDHNYVRTRPLGKASVDPADPSKVAPPTLDPNGMVEFVIGTGGVDTYAASAATAQALAPFLAAYQVGKPSPGLFGAGGFHLKSDRYTFSYLPAANSAPFTDSAGRTCRRATNGQPEDVPGDQATATLATQAVTWAPTNTTVKASSGTGGIIYPGAKASTNGDGVITYAVTSEGATGCSVDATKGVIKYTDAGECEVTAMASGTMKYAGGRRAVAFTITSNGPFKKQDMTAVQPAVGPLSGGNTIILLGHGFTDATKVTMEGTSARFTVVSDTRISVVVPEGKQAGPVGIHVSVGPPQGAIVAPTAYTYVDASGTEVSTSAAAPGVIASANEAILGNPETARILVPGLRLLSRSDATHVRSTVLKRAPGTSAATAPTVRMRAGTPFSIVVGTQAPGQIVNVRGRIRGTSVALGSARVDEKGSLTIPALAVTRVGVVTLGLVTVSSGKQGYVKVLVVK